MSDLNQVVATLEKGEGDVEFSEYLEAFGQALKAVSSLNPLESAYVEFVNASEDPMKVSIGEQAEHLVADLKKIMETQNIES